MIKKVLAMILCGLIMYPAWAQEILGPSYPITEPDMLEAIQHKLKSMEKTVVSASFRKKPSSDRNKASSGRIQ